MRKCNINNCENKHYCKGYCLKHYAKFKKYADPLKGREVEKHGFRKRIEYKIWVSMKQRCSNLNHKSFKHYGGRGITVCDRWKNSFLAFLEDIGERPSDKHSIDRIDNDGNYEPGNVSWSTQIKQNRNRRVFKTNKSGYTGVVWSKKAKKWIVQISINKNQKYLGSFKNLDDAIKARKDAEKKYW
jgi:hypothetical protein